jgi:hypothetical protein
MAGTLELDTTQNAALETAPFDFTVGVRRRRSARRRESMATATGGSKLSAARGKEQDRPSEGEHGRARCNPEL